MHSGNLDVSFKETKTVLCRLHSSGSIACKQPENRWSCIAHLNAEDMLKSAVTEEKFKKYLNLIEMDQGQ